MAHAFDNRNFTPDKQENHSSNRYEQTSRDEYFPVTSHEHINETKPPPPPTRMISTLNNNYIRRSNILSTNRTYWNSTQLYISEPSPPPPPPPPRYPLSPPVIPPRNPRLSPQKNSITIPDFNSSSSAKVIYRSPVPISPIESDHSPLIIDTNPPIHDATIGEYFGECHKCGETITSFDDPCVLLGQLHHASCAVCVVCGQSVKNKHFYIKDQLYCEEDFLNSNLTQSSTYCVVCHRLITDTIIQAVGDPYHFNCFKCSKCSMYLDGKPFIRNQHRILFCLPDYHLTHGIRCHKCSKTILPEDNSNETVRIISMGKSYHLQCYRCEDCSMQLGEEEDRRCYPIDQCLLCEDCCHQRMIPMNKF